MKLMNIAAGLVFLGFIGSASISIAEDATKTGKDIFTEAKCEKCHAIASQSIESKGKAPDLSNIGAAVKADDLKLYLNKESEINGKKHPIKFKGEAADLEILAKWIETLKSEN